MKNKKSKKNCSFVSSHTRAQKRQRLSSFVAEERPPRENNDDDDDDDHYYRVEERMAPTPGIHTPDEPYVPSSDKCWGAKGHWHMKKPVDVMFENQAKVTPCSVPENGHICGNDQNWEVRLKEEHSQFVPNAKNFAPRPKNWKANRNKNYYGTN